MKPFVAFRNEVSRMKRDMLFALALLLFVAPAWAARTMEVNGNVSDQINHTPIVGAQVVYTNVKSGEVYNTTTDKKGHYSIKAVRMGDYRIVVTSPSGDKLVEITKHVEQETQSAPGPVAIGHVPRETVHVGH